MPGSVLIECCATQQLANERRTALSTPTNHVHIVTGSVGVRWYDATGVSSRTEIESMRQSKAASFLVIVSGGT